MTRRNLLSVLITATVALAGKTFAQTTTQSPKQPNIKSIAEANAKQIMLLMDTDKDGRISKKEWMDFMSAEFDRLDTDHNGFIDQHDLMATTIHVQHVSPALLGK
jgi:Ca2+-binding EF-hand superfamily protein